MLADMEERLLQTKLFDFLKSRAEITEAPAPPAS